MRDSATMPVNTPIKSMGGLIGGEARKLNEYRKKSEYMNIAALLQDIYNKTDFLNLISAMPGGQVRRANLMLLINKAKTFSNSGYSGLYNFIRYISKLKDFDNDFGEASILSENDDIVRIMTIHKSKGLEFPHVFLIGMEEGILPHQTSIDEDNVAEERRLAYVGITRAQQTLCFTLCKERRQFGELIKPEPSRFLLELPQDDLQWERDKPPMTEQQKQEKTAANIANLRALLKRN